MPSDGKRNLVVRVEPELLEQAHELANDRDLSVSQLVRKLLRDAYARRRPSGEARRTR